MILTLTASIMYWSLQRKASPVENRGEENLAAEVEDLKLEEAEAEADPIAMENAT